MFQVFEKGFEELRVEFLETQGGRFPAETIGGELQQEAEGVAIAGDSMGTGPLLGYQPVSEKPLEESWKAGGEFHRSPPGRCTVPRRLVARASSSGTASMYQ